MKNELFLLLNVYKYYSLYIAIMYIGTFTDCKMYNFNIFHIMHIYFSTNITYEPFVMLIFAITICAQDVSHSIKKIFPFKCCSYNRVVPNKKFLLKPTATGVGKLREQITIKSMMTVKLHWTSFLAL